MLKISHKIFCFLKYFLYIYKWIKDIRLMVNFSNFNSLHSVASYFSNEDKCKQAIVESRWSNGDIICPYCGQHHCNKRSDADSVAQSATRTLARRLALSLRTQRLALQSGSWQCTSFLLIRRVSHRTSWQWILR